MVFIGPYEHHSNELPWRESVADVVTIREDRAGPRRPRPPRARAAPPRGPGAEDRQLLGRVERDRDRHRRRRGGDRAAPPRRAVVLGLRGRRSVSPDRHEPGAGRRRTATWPTRTRCSSRRTSSSAAPGRPGCWWPSARCCATAFRRCRAAARSCSSARPVSATTPIRRSARRAEPRRSSSRSAPGWRSRSRTRSAVEEIRRREHDLARRALASWAENPQIEILGNTDPERLAIVSIGLRHAGAPAARQLRRRRPQRPVRHPGAQRLLLRRALHPPLVPDRRRVVGAHARRGRRTVTWAPSSPSPGSASTTTSASRRSPTSSTPSTCSPARAGSCCRSTASIPAAGLWHHRAAGPRPATRLRDALTDKPARLHTAPERVLGRSARGGTPDHRRGAGAAADRSARRPGGQRGVRAHPLVPSPGRGPRPPASRRRCLNDRGPRPSASPLQPAMAR